MPLIESRVNGERVKLYVVPPPTPQLTARFKRFVAASPLLGLDVETTAIDELLGVWQPEARLRLIQFGSYSAAWCLDPMVPEWRLLIERLLRDRAHRFVSHTNYDPLWCRREFKVDLCKSNQWIDTHTLACMIYPGERTPKGLKELCDRHIDKGLSAAETALLERFRELAPVGERTPKKLKAWGFTNIALTDDTFGLYAGLDAIYARRLADELSREIAARSPKLKALSRREQRIARLCTSMQVRGLRCDVPRTKAVLAEINADYEVADARLTEHFGFTPRSPRRSAVLLDMMEIPHQGGKVPGPMRDHVGVPLTATGLLKLDKDTIPELAIRLRGHEALAPIIADYLSLSTNKNVRDNLRKVLTCIDSRGLVHPKFNTQQAITGRMSIVRPAMQTFKKTDKRLRGCWISREGKTFVRADYDSQEIRIAAAFSGDPALRRVVFDGLNQHDVTAESIFGANYSEEQRHTSKTLNFAIQYGAGPRKIALTLGIPVPEARKLWEAWRQTYAGYVKWMKHVEQADVVVNPWGRMIPKTPGQEYANANYAIQSTGRDLLGDALVKLDDAGYGSSIWLPVHDEIILEVPTDKAEEACRALEVAMAAQIKDVPFTATAVVLGNRWSGEN